MKAFYRTASLLCVFLAIFVIFSGMVAAEDSTRTNYYVPGLNESDGSVMDYCTPNLDVECTTNISADGFICDLSIANNFENSVEITCKFMENSEGSSLLQNSSTVLSPNEAKKCYLNPGDNIPKGDLKFKVIDQIENKTSFYQASVSDNSISLPLEISEEQFNEYGIVSVENRIELTIENVSNEIPAEEAVPTITWSNPADITFGTELSETQLNAVANDPATGSPVDGTFVYTPVARTILSAGTHTLHADFTPTDVANYTTVSKDVTINIFKLLTPPVANFTADKTEGTTPLTVKFTDKSTNSPTGWKWNLGDGSTSTEQNPEHIFSIEDIYTVTLVATNGDGSSDAKSMNIKVNRVPTLPVANFSADPTEGYTPLSVQFTDLSEDADAVAWDFNNDGIADSEDRNPINIFTDSGTYMVNLTAINTNGIDSKTATISVLKATPTITWDNPADIIFGAALNSTQLNAVASVPGTFVYTPTEGTVLNAGTQTLKALFVPADSTNYTGGTASVQIKVNPAQFSSITSTNFHAPTTFGSNGYDYIWFNANFKASGLQDGTIIYFTSSQITAKDNITAPSATITFSSTVTNTSTYFDSNKNAWITTAPLSGTDDIFLSGMLLPIQSGDWPSNNKATWSGYFSTNTAGVSLSWKFGSAVYTNDSGGYNNLGVKASHNNAEGYKNGDHAGTPENLKSYLVAGGSGGGGSNWCGSWSGTKSVNP